MADAKAATAAATGERRILDAFAAAREEGRAALMPYMMGGFPGQAAATEIARAYADSGADLIELGVPYSDPLADGPVIHAAATASLASGANLESVLETAAAVSDRVPVVLMAYANMLLAVGPERFAGEARSAGAAGVIAPDLPIDEAGEIGEALAADGLALVPLLAPSTPPERRAEICSHGQGFVYVVSTAGTTGERDELPPGLADLVHAAQEDAEVPVAVGFGIGTPEQAAAVGALADGVIIGSRLVRAVSDAGGTDAAVAAVSEFLRATAGALRG